jgi:hypothetical protein
VQILIENQELRNEMGIRAQSYAKANHTAQKMVQEVFKLF